MKEQPVREKEPAFQPIASLTRLLYFMYLGGSSHHFRETLRDAVAFHLLPIRKVLFVALTFYKP